MPGFDASPRLRVTNNCKSLALQTLEPGEVSGAQHRTHANKGSEAMGYLQFILDYWERLPATMAFIHGHR